MTRYLTTSAETVLVYRFSSFEKWLL